MSNGRLYWTFYWGSYSLLKIKYIHFELILVIIKTWLLKYYLFLGLFRYIFLVHHEGFTVFLF
jgi:hypothetical protein